MRPQLEWTTASGSGAAGVKAPAPAVYGGMAAARRGRGLGPVFPLSFPDPSFLHLLISNDFMEKEVMEVRDNKEEGSFVWGFAGFLTPSLSICADLTPSYLWGYTIIVVTH